MTSIQHDDDEDGTLHETPSTDAETSATSANTEVTRRVNKRKSSTPKRRGGAKHTVAAARDAVDGVKKKRKYRHRPGTVATREIRKYQLSTDTLIDKAPFVRLVREITEEIKPGIRWQREAINAIQGSAEALIVQMFMDALNYMQIGKRKTLTKEDLFIAFTNYCSHQDIMKYTPPV